MNGVSTKFWFLEGCGWGGFFSSIHYDRDCDSSLGWFWGLFVNRSSVLHWEVPLLGAVQKLRSLRRRKFKKMTLYVYPIFHGNRIYFFTQKSSRKYRKKEEKKKNSLFLKDRRWFVTSDRKATLHIKRISGNGEVCLLFATNTELENYIQRKCENGEVYPLFSSKIHFFPVNIFQKIGKPSFLVVWSDLLHAATTTSDIHISLLNNLTFTMGEPHRPTLYLGRYLSLLSLWQYDVDFIRVL